MKKAVELSIKTIAIMILILIVVFVSVALFLNEMNKGKENFEKMNKKQDINKIVDDVINEAK